MRPAVQLDDARGDGEPQAGAAIRERVFDKWIEQKALPLARSTSSKIACPDPSVPVWMA